MTNPLRWAIVLVDFSPVVGHEQDGVRPALVVSYEPFHRTGRATVCPITGRDPKYPGEVAIRVGQAGQTKPGAILCHQVRTIDLERVTTYVIGGKVQYVSDREIRLRVRDALSRHLGLDVPPAADGAS